MGKKLKSTRNIQWIEKYCRIPDGPDAGKLVRLRSWQKHELRRIYDNPHGTRRAILSFGRKNGKTALAAFLLLLHLCGPEARHSSQLYSAAMSRDQAAIVFNYAANMVRMSPSLKPHVGIRETAKQLYYNELRTVYRALSADATTAYGLSPVFILHDELGQVRGPRHPLYEALETATGAQESPLSIIISTQAPTDADLLSVLIDDALEENDPRVICSLYTAPDDMDPFCRATIKKANPAFGDFLNEIEVMDMADAARRMPSRESEYRNLILNQRVEAESPFVTKTVWEENGREGHLSGAIYGGLDLSETNDLTALILVSPKGDGLHVESTFWLPEEGLAERSRSDRVPYDVWADNGSLKTTPGSSVEYRYVAGYIAKLFREHDVRKIAFDRYNIRHLKPWLIEAGLSESMIEDRFVDFGQGYVSMSPALRNLESLMLNGKLRHAMHPVLTMCATNAIVKMDEAGNRKLDKKRSRGRIDGMVALAMAASVASEDMYQQPVYPVEIANITEDIHA